MPARFSHAVLLSAPVLVLALPSAAVAQSASEREAHDARPVATATRFEGAIRIDGRLDEAAWAAAPVIDGFTQIDPEEGAPSTQRTEVRILYDDDALYVGARLHDTGEVIGRLGRRDMALGDSDWFGVMLDSYHDHRTAFGFDVNPAGVRRDEVKVIESDDNSWDPVWDVATTVDEGGWTAEYRIPFSQIRFSAAEDQTWGLQLERMIGRAREYSVSTFIPKSAQGGVPGYGHLTGLRGLTPGRRLELLPYAVARTEHVEPGPNPYRTDSEQDMSVGLDLKYRLTSNLTLDATVNPDFGQVEVDPAVINLGVYETRFDEKRFFFIEGSEIFDMDTGGGGQLFYTRRIGRAPQVHPGTPRADVPAATAILGATKLSGRTASGWSLGIMEAVTGSETSRYIDAQGLDATATAEPLTNYFVGRARRDLRSGRSAAGGVVTAVHRSMDDPSALAALHDAAYTAATDVRHEWADRTWSLRGALAISHVRGSADALLATQTRSSHYFQRPDARHLTVDPDATSLTGASGFVSLERQAGDHWLGGVTLATITPGFEVNDLGFGYRTDRRDGQVDLRYRQNQPGDRIRSWYVAGSARAEGNYDNQLIANWLTATGMAQTTGYWILYSQVRHSLRAHDDRLTRGGPLATRPASSSAMLHFSTDGRRPLLAAGTLSGDRTEFGAWGARASLSLRWRPSSSWDIRVGPEWSHRVIDAQWIATIPDNAATETFGARYVFAPLEYRELGLETRLNMAFSPALSLELYAQPLLSSGQYGNPLYLTTPDSYDFADYDGTTPDRDFNLRSLRGNAVLRWEWRQGSTLFLAWQQARQDYMPGSTGDTDFDFSRDQRALWNASPDNIFVLKVNYWLNP